MKWFERQTTLSLYHTARFSRIRPVLLPPAKYYGLVVFQCQSSRSDYFRDAPTTIGKVVRGLILGCLVDTAKLGRKVNCPSWSVTGCKFSAVSTENPHLPKSDGLITPCAVASMSSRFASKKTICSRSKH